MPVRCEGTGMQILYCDSCGAKLPELDVPSNVDVAYCEKCAAERNDPLNIMTQVPVAKDAGHSSAIRLRAISGESGVSSTPTQVPVARDAGRSSSIRLRAITDDSDGPAHQSSTSRTPLPSNTNRRRSSGRLRSSTAVRPKLQMPTDRAAASSTPIPPANSTTSRRIRKKAGLRRFARTGSTAVGTCIIALCAALCVFVVFNRNKPVPTQVPNAGPNAPVPAKSVESPTSLQPKPSLASPPGASERTAAKAGADPKATADALAAKSAAESPPVP